MTEQFIEGFFVGFFTGYILVGLIVLWVCWLIKSTLKNKNHDEH